MLSAAFLHRFRYLSPTLNALGSVADPDPGSGAFLTSGSRIWDGLKFRIRILDPKSGMNNPDYIS
jgi:hypothetical protein